MPRATHIWILICALGLAATSSASADRSARELVEARSALTRYDRYGGTLRTIARLSGALERLEGVDHREARFLRAVAATDLRLIAGDQLARVDSELGRAFGVPASEIVTFLDAELRGLEFGAYAETTADCRWALHAMSAAVPTRLREQEGLRRDVLFVQSVVNALDQVDELERLARLGTDPCAEGTTSCRVESLPEPTRRALGALLEASRLVDRLEEIARAGEPLTRALAALVATDGAVLRTTTLNPPLQLPLELGAHGVGAWGSPAHSELVFVVGMREIRYGFAPGFRVRDGEIHATGPEPRLPETASLAFADDGRAIVAPYEALVGALDSLAPHRERRIGVAAWGEVPALTMSRVLLSFQRAGLAVPELLGRGPNQEARSVPIVLAYGESTPTTGVSLFVRMGGYTLHRGRASDSIPRVRDDAGLHFDLQTLEMRARAAGGPAAIRYMGVVDWGSVLEAAFHMPTQAPLAVVLY